MKNGEVRSGEDRKMKNSNAANSGDSKPAGAEAKKEASGDNASSSNGEAVDEEPAHPRRRTGRPGKKVKAEVEANSSKKPVEEDEKPRNGAPPREVKRRNTRRVAKPKDESEQDSDGKKDADEPASWGGGFLSW